MKAGLIAAIATGVLLGLGGYLINSYGNARFDAGYNKYKAEIAAASANGTAKDAVVLEEIANETKAMSDSDIDADLLKLGVMRGENDL